MNSRISDEQAIKDERFIYNALEGAVKLGLELNSKEYFRLEEKLTDITDHPKNVSIKGLAEVTRQLEFYDVLTLLQLKPSLINDCKSLYQLLFYSGIQSEDKVAFLSYHIELLQANSAEQTKLNTTEIAGFLGETHRARFKANAKSALTFNRSTSPITLFSNKINPARKKRQQLALTAIPSFRHQFVM